MEKVFLKISQIHVKTYALKSLFNKAAAPWPPTLIKRDSNANVFL